MCLEGEDEWRLEDCSIVWLPELSCRGGAASAWAGKALEYFLPSMISRLPASGARSTQEKKDGPVPPAAGFLTGVQTSIGWPLVTPKLPELLEGQFLRGTFRDGCLSELRSWSPSTTSCSPRRRQDSTTSSQPITVFSQHGWSLPYACSRPFQIRS